MDNFPSGKTGQIVAGLKQQPPGSLEQQRGYRKRTRLKEIKKPWGW